jgi:imidazole glycerol phosphate synthase glutamine amidotransferase subunit
VSVVIVRTGSANLASVLAAFDRLGVPARLTADPREIADAERLVLPGVGSFGAAMASLDASGLVEPLRARIASGKPTLAVCLGLQLLAESSDESPGVRGLGVIPARVTRFDPRSTGNRTVPQMGWKRIAPTPDAVLLRNGWAYYANSYKLDAVPDGWAGATSVYGTPFVAALERGPVLACQFHPELSGPDGLELIQRWLEAPSAREGVGGGLSPSSNARRVTEPTTPPPPSGSRSVRVIPCLDVRDGRVVKGVRFQNLRDAGDPVQQAAEYERQGADELVMLDVSATPEGRSTAAKTVAAIRRVISIPLTVGGGVRTRDDAARLLDAGADKVGVNTAAVERPELITDLAERFGRQCVVLALDAAMVADFGHDRRRNIKSEPPSMDADASPPSINRERLFEDHGVLHPNLWEVVIRSGRDRTGLDAILWAERAAELGAGEILLTSWDRDGTGLGYDLDLLRAITSAVRVPVIASGGAKTADHLAAAACAGASAVLAATIFHDGETTVQIVKHGLWRLGIETRLDASMSHASIPSSRSHKDQP